MMEAGQQSRPFSKGLAATPGIPGDPGDGQTLPSRRRPNGGLLVAEAVVFLLGRGTDLGVAETGRNELE